jgi:hypothetical protein
MSTRCATDTSLCATTRSSFLFPPLRCVTLSDGGWVHWNGPHLEAPPLTIMWLHTLPIGVLCQTCHPKRVGAFGSAARVCFPGPTQSLLSLRPRRIGHGRRLPSAVWVSQRYCSAIPIFPLRRWVSGRILPPRQFHPRFTISTNVSP